MIDAILNTLQNGPKTAFEIADQLEMDPVYVIMCLHRENGEAWRSFGNKWVLLDEVWY